VAAPGSAGFAEDWLSLCYGLTERVERITTRGALLDLGPCIQDEAVADVGSLLQRLAHIGLQAVAGIGPTYCLAQIATYSLAKGRRRTPPVTVAVVGPSEAAALLYRAPVTLLSRLHPAGSVTEEEVERLHRFGLHTCGRIARLGELALRRQFGDEAGRFLFAVCRGLDPRPLVPTPQPARLAYRLRLADPLAMDAVRAELTAFAEHIARDLAFRRRSARALRLTLTWESGATRTVHAHLRQYICESRLLAAELARLFVDCLPDHAGSSAPLADHRPGRPAIVALRATLGDLALAAPAQATLWRTPAQQRAALRAVADALTRRYRRPALLTLRVIAPDAIFSEDRYTLVPLAEEASIAPANDAPARSLNGNLSDPWRDVPHRLHWW
jgi:hypothetical protein